MNWFRMWWARCLRVLSDMATAIKGKRLHIFDRQWLEPARHLTANPVTPALPSSTALPNQQLDTTEIPLTQTKKDTTMAINSVKLGSILQNFVTSTSDIQGAALVSPDGLPLATSLPGNMDDERVSAMSSAMVSLGERIASELSRGTVERILVEGTQGFAILTSCGEEAVLIVLASESAKQGLLMLETKRLLAELKLVLR